MENKRKWLVGVVVFVVLLAFAVLVGYWLSQPKKNNNAVFQMVPRMLAKYKLSNKTDYLGSDGQPVALGYNEVLGDKTVGLVVGRLMGVTEDNGKILGQVKLDDKDQVTFVLYDPASGWKTRDVLKYQVGILNPASGQLKAEKWPAAEALVKLKELVGQDIVMKFLTSVPEFFNTDPNRQVEKTWLASTIDCTKQLMDQLKNKQAMNIGCQPPIYTLGIYVP